MNSKVYKCCVVPQCINTSIKTPNKLFLYVPYNKTMRNKWLTLARRDPKTVGLKSTIYFCEDHFDLPNVIEYHMMGSVTQVRTKRGCVPTKFECQPDRMCNTADTERPYLVKKLRNSDSNDSEESSITLKHLELGEISSGTSAALGISEHYTKEHNTLIQPEQTTSELPARLIENEYESLKSYNSSDLSALAILERPAEATGVSQETVKTNLKIKKRSVDSGKEPSSEKRHKQCVFDEDVSAINEDWSVENVDKDLLEEPENDEQSDESEVEIETMKLEFYEDEDYNEDTLDPLRDTRVKSEPPDEECQHSTYQTEPLHLTASLSAQVKLVTPEDDPLRRADTRRPCRGRGVRVRGGRGDAASGPLPAVEGVVVERVRGRGGRGIAGPTDADRIALVTNILQYPQDRGLEVPLHPKKRRVRKPSDSAVAGPSWASLPPPPSRTPACAPAPQQPSDSAVAGPSWASLPPARSPSPPTLPPTSSGSIYSVPSPAVYVDRTVRQQQQHPPPPRRGRNIRDDDIDFTINYGSEPESCDSDDEEGDGIALPRKSQHVQCFAETPLDSDYPAPAEPSVEVGADFGHLISAGEGPEANVPGVPQEATEKPWGLFDFDWRTFPETPIPPPLRREMFSAINVGPTTPSSNPYDIFIDIWDREIMEHIASETNRCAQQLASKLLQSGRLRPRSRITKWRDTGVSELYVLMAIILAMGVVVKSRLEEYWNATADIFCTPGFSAHMSIDRFVMLSKCLHFNNNEDMCAENLTESEARLYKIQPILSHLNKKFQEMYTPDQNIALDESLLMWKGCLKFSQLIPNKAARRGIKSYEICESRTGYLWRFSIHAASRTPLQHNNDPLAAATPALVLQMIAGLEHKGYTLWMDNYYNSPALSRRLKSIGFDCVGTLRTDRKFVPQAINSLTKGNMTQGEIAGLTSGDIDVMVWRDTNRVAMTSTYHGNGIYSSQQSTKPILIHDYNIMMGGVDKKDQLLSGYPVERKRTRVWYKKLFRRLLNASVLNAYVICKHSSFLPHRDFRVKLINDILSRHSTPRPIHPILKPGPAPAQTVDLTHHLELYPMSTHQRKRCRCAQCAKLVNTFCAGCRKPLCLTPCFMLYTHIPYNIFICKK